MKFIGLLLLLTLCVVLPAAAADDDIVLRAMTDEMNRSLKELHLHEHPAPYFVSYTVKETETVEMVSSLGSEAFPRYSRYRYLVPDVRVGSYELDNSNYGPAKDQFFAYGQCVSNEDDYGAIRRAVWRRTDEAYKSAIEHLESKRSYLNENKIANTMPDMTAVPPVVSLGPVHRLEYDQKKWLAKVKDLSAIFLKYPKIKTSKITFVARETTRWFVNSEGTRIRESAPQYGILALVDCQTEDGNPLEDAAIFAWNEAAEEPSSDDLQASVNGFAKSISDAISAPTADDYCGPVLFEGDAAAVFMGEILMPNLCGAEECVRPSSESSQMRNPLKDMLGRRILPTFLSLTDDPRSRSFHNLPLVGGYNFDDQGVPAQKVVIAENGLLKEFCQSRIPTRYRSTSNGHGYHDRSDTSILELSSSQTLSHEALKQKLIELGKEEGLKQVLIIRKIHAAYDLDDYFPQSEDGATTYFPPSHSRQPNNPTVVIRVDVETGKEEIVSGLQFRYVSLRSFRDIRAVGDDAAPHFVQNGGGPAKSVITPSYLVGEVELAKLDLEHHTHPKLPSPLIDP